VKRDEATGIENTASALRPSPASPFEPLKIPVFRMLWIVVVVTTVCMWMSDVASAWMMTSLTLDPIWVALVQTAATLPMFMLGLPSGALADVLDRKWYLFVTQCWLATSATLLYLSVVFELMSIPLLLALTLMNGIGLAMRWPIYGALIPETVPRVQLPQAQALNSVATNLSRIFGPLVAGLLIASAGTEWVFAINAVLSSCCAYAVFRWKRVHTPDPLGKEPLLSAMRVGLQYVRQSTTLRGLLLRVFIFFFHASAVLALLPLIAKRAGGDARTFSFLVACMGAGAITQAMILPRVRRYLSRSQFITLGAAIQAASGLVLATTSSVFVAAPVMFIFGMSWLSTANSFAVSVQTALPDWVRARGISIYQICLTGGSAIGAAAWGQVASWSTLDASLLLAACSGLPAMWLVQRFATQIDTDEDLTLMRVLEVPVPATAPRGRVVVNIAYEIDPARSRDFLAVMQACRRARLRQGARQWSLLHDLSEPSRYVEQIIDESWTGYVRRFDRITTSDAALRQRVLAFHVAPTPPAVSRYVIED
jgi:MFS family permease